MTERKLRNKWSIKAVYYSEHNRQCYLDGPWKETVGGVSNMAVF